MRIGLWCMCIVGLLMENGSRLRGRRWGVSEETKMWEALQCLPDAVEHLTHGDSDDADSVKASNAIKWAIAEIDRLREERKPVGWCVQAAAVLIQVKDEAEAKMLSAVYGYKVLAIVEADAKEEHNVPLQK